MEVRGVDFVSYQVSDMDKAIGFYRDTLGLPLNMTYEGFWSEFSAGDVTIALTVPQSGEASSAGGGGAAVALAVDDVEAAAADLKEKGVPVVFGPEETPVCHMAMIVDPDGNPIWLHRRKDGTVG